MYMARDLSDLEKKYYRDRSLFTREGGGAGRNVGGSYDFHLDQ